MTTQEYWRQVRFKEAELKERYPSGFLFVSSTNDPMRNTYAGDAVEVSLLIASKMVTEGTAREATAEEIATSVRHGQESLYRSQAAQLRSDGITRVILSKTQ
jgi:hypothetical protein